MPVCNQYDIKMAIHPDDPAWSVFGLPRIITNKQNLFRMMKMLDGKNYVYVLGENNIWETKWITVGLEGKDNVEITDGLSEGDMVILK